MIILSIALAIFLLAAIVLTIGLIKLVKEIRKITIKAEEIVDDVEAVSGFFRKAAGPVALTSLVNNIVTTVADFKDKKGKKK